MSHLFVIMLMAASFIGGFICAYLYVFSSMMERGKDYKEARINYEAKLAELHKIRKKETSETNLRSWQV